VFKAEDLLLKSLGFNPSLRRPLLFGKKEIQWKLLNVRGHSNNT
jgi:hypothetical protein